MFFIQIKFTHVVCRQTYEALSVSTQLNSQNVDINNSNKKSTFLHLSQGDQVCIISERNKDFLFGQNTKTREFGEFPKSVCSLVDNVENVSNTTKINVSSNVKTNTTKLIRNGEISFPVVGRCFYIFNFLN